MNINEYSTEVQYDSDTEDYFITIPPSLVDELQWVEGDVLEWEYHDYNGLPGLRLHKIGE
jgi:hypothetical protein